ncbi:hypothetical protein MLD38_036571 [Melastoma candidum]|uniref:Uncharacterized protein n=1 Tax=Melastoma candidum TaxID=119954 RepID=A0ACB9LLA7_9MYRT|nr:hypothetical protein MLD38_036571 [Melastoma candidum]
MAGGAIVSDNRKQYPGNMTFRVFVTCFVAATGGLIFGYDLGISGGVTSMDSFLKEFFPRVYKRESSVRPSDNQYCKFNDETLTLFTSSLYLAALLSSSVSSFLTRSLGRKFTMFLGGTLFFAGAICNAAAKYLWMLYVGRMLLGFGIGCVNQSVPIYVSETAPAKAGRRTLFIEGGLQMLVCQLFITAAIAWKFGVSGHPGILPGWYTKSLVALICIYIAGYAWSWGPLGWLVPSEIFPLEIRSAAQSINVGVNMVCTFIIAQIFAFILCKFKFGLFIFFMVFVIIMTIFIYTRLPETKGIPIEDMQQVWKDHPHWSKYVKDENEQGTTGGEV